MGLGVRRRTGVCFCNENCPPYTWPYYQYFLRVTGPLTPYPNWKLFRLTQQPSSFPICSWQPVSPIYGVGNELLEKRALPDLPSGDKRWQWFLTIFTGFVLWQFKVTMIWDPPGPVPSNPVMSFNCSYISYNLAENVPLPLHFAELRAAYPDACDDADHPAKVQTKLPPSLPK